MTASVQLKKDFDNLQVTTDEWTTGAEVRAVANRSVGVWVASAEHASGSRRIAVKTYYNLPGYDTGSLSLYLSEAETDSLVRTLIAQLATLRTGVSA